MTVAAIHREWGKEPEVGAVYYVDAHQVEVPRRRGDDIWRVVENA